MLAQRNKLSKTPLQRQPYKHIDNGLEVNTKTYFKYFGDGECFLAFNFVISSFLFSTAPSKMITSGKVLFSSSSECYAATTDTFQYPVPTSEEVPLTISEIANKIQNKTGAKIHVNKNRDLRSYRQDSSRLLKFGFRPKYNVSLAINDLIYFFKTKSKINFTKKNFNLLRMKELNIK